MNTMENMGNLVYIEDAKQGGFYLTEDDLATEAEALTPTGRLQCRYRKYETDKGVVLYARSYTFDDRCLLHYLDGKGWSKPAYDDARPWIMQTVGEPEFCGTVVCVYSKRGSFECNDKVYFKY